MESKYIDPTRLSIESQTAVKCLVELTIAGKEIPDDLKYGMWWWMRTALKPHLGVLTGVKNENYKI